MNCSEARPHLPTHADGELEPQYRPLVEAHVAACPGCRAEVSRWQALRTASRRVIEAECPCTAFRTRLQTCLRIETSRRPQQIIRWSLGVAAVAAVVAGIAFFRPFRTDDIREPAAPTPVVAGLTVTADDFASVYKFCANDQRHDQWRARGMCPKKETGELREKMKFAVMVPDLSADGYKLDGVCTCLRLPKAHAVHAFYRRENGTAEVVSFFTIDRCVRLDCCQASGCGGAAKRTYEVATEDGVNVLKWDSCGQSYAVCGKLDRAELAKLADEVVVSLQEQRTVPAVASANLP